MDGVPGEHRAEAGRAGKLIEAARWWVTGGRAAEDEDAKAVKADMAALGADQDQVDEMLARLERTSPPRPPTFDVHPENWPTIQAFGLYAATQWRVGPTGRPYALDYAAVKAALDLDGRELEPGTFERLRLLEAGIITAWSTDDG